MDRVPETHQPGQDLKCSEQGLPNLDLLASILTGVAATAIIVEQHRVHDCELFGKCTGISLAVGGPLYLVAALYAVSSWFGYDWAEECESWKTGK